MKKFVTVVLGLFLFANAFDFAEASNHESHFTSDESHNDKIKRIILEVERRYPHNYSMQEYKIKQEIESLNHVNDYKSKYGA